MLFRATTTRLERLDDEILTSGSYNINYLRFEFSEDWDGMIKTATIRSELGIFHVMLDSQNRASIPQSALLYPGTIDVGVFGIKGTVIQPTVWVEDIRVWPGAYDPDILPSFTDPTLYEQIMSTLSDAMTKGVYDPRGLTRDIFEYAEAAANNKPSFYDSIHHFPNQGLNDHMYVARDTNKIYRWQNSTLTYVCIGSDYTEVTTLNGGQA